jgi:hypothetical protein
MMSREVCSRFSGYGGLLWLMVLGELQLVLNRPFGFAGLAPSCSPAIVSDAEWGNYQGRDR